MPIFYQREVHFVNSVADVWKNILDRLKKDLSETTISTWFSEVEPVDIRNNTLFLFCPNDFHRGYVISLFSGNIKSVLKDIFSMDFDVKVMDTAEMEAFTGSSERQNKDSFPSDGFTFDTFVVGPSNKLAFAASVSVATKPGKNYNPLLIYGDSGLGKTHLIYAIANTVRKENPGAKILYFKGDDFVNEFVELVRAGRGSEFRTKYRDADVLLVDDVQFVAGKEQVQNEFFHTFNTLYEAGRQIVLTSDRPPAEMTLLDDRLRTRFEWGLLADVTPPDLETRVAIIKNKAAMMGMNMTDRLAIYIARNVTANVRQLEGAVTKILAYKDLLGDEENEETAARAILDIVKRDAEYIPSPEAILDYISKYYKIEESVICGQQRVRAAVAARQAAIFLIRSMTNLSLDEIGKIFGNRDHSTIIYSIEQVEKKMEKEPAYAETIKEMKTNISSKR